MADQRFVSGEDHGPQPSSRLSRSAGPLMWAWTLGVASCIAAGVCLLLVYGLVAYHLRTALYVAGLAAGLGIGIAAVRVLRGGGPSRRASMLGALGVCALGLGLTIFCHGRVRRRLDVDARVAAVRVMLTAMEQYASQKQGKLPDAVTALRNREAVEAVLSDPPGGLERGAYVFMKVEPFTRKQLLRHGAGREVILLHDGSDAGREPVVVGLLNGDVRTLSWPEFSGLREEQNAWLDALRIQRKREAEAQRAATQPSTAPAATTAPTTTRAATEPASRPATRRIRTTVPAEES